MKKLWKWLRREILVKSMIVYILIAELIFWSPVIVTALLAIIINPWFWTICFGVMVFWAGPFTPAVPLQIGLALGIKKFVKIFKKTETEKYIKAIRRYKHDTRRKITRHR